MTHSRSWASRALAACGTLALAGFALVVPTLPAHADDACADYNVIDSGHVDAFEAKVAGGKLDLHVKWDKPTGEEVFSAPEKTVFVLDKHTLTDVPAGVNGLPSQGYFTGQVQDFDRPWIGWDFGNVKRLNANSATLHIDEVSGPGTLSLWLDRGYGQGVDPLVKDKATLDVTSGDKIVDEFISHKHFNWLFAKKGIYKLKTHLVAGSHTSPAHTYTFAVDTPVSEACQAKASSTESTTQPTTENEKPHSNKGEKEDNGKNDIGTFHPGDILTLNATAFDPNGGKVTFTFDEPKTVLAAAEPDGKGNVAHVEGKLPENAKEGKHTITVAQGDSKVVLTLTVAKPQEAKPSDPPSPVEIGKPKDSSVTVGSGSGQQAASVSQGSASTTETCLPTKVTRKITAEEAKRYGTGTTGVTLTPKMKDDRTAPATWVNPESLTFGLGPAAKMQAPADLNQYGFSGAVYSIGATQVAGVPWLGANTQNDSVVTAVDGPVTWRLDSVSGPGKLIVFESGNFGQVLGKMWFRNVGDTHTLGLHTHVHPNWIFSAPGTYKVKISESAKLKTGQTVTGSTTLTFLVGAQGNANEGHFDLGAEIGAGGAAGKAVATKNADGSYTLTEVVGRTPSGKPCQLGGPLAKTGSSTVTAPLVALGAGLLVGGIGFTMLRREFLLKR